MEGRDNIHGAHQRTSQCKQGLDWKQQQLAVEDEREFTTRDFGAYGRPLKMVNAFRYLGRVVLVADDDWPAVVSKLSQVRAVWMRMTQILVR